MTPNAGAAGTVRSKVNHNLNAEEQPVTHQPSNKWSITRTGPYVLIEFLDPDAANVVARALFDGPAIREFREALDQAVDTEAAS